MTASTGPKSRGGSESLPSNAGWPAGGVRRYRKGQRLIGGYRRKSEAQLKWNAIKKAAIARATLEAAIYRERVLNDLLTGAWEQFEKSLQSGELLELDPGSFDEFDAS